MTVIAFVWDNFGPMHDDRVRAVSNSLEGQSKVFGIELFGKSDTYDWDNESNTDFPKKTVFSRGGFSDTSVIKVSAALYRQVRKIKAKHVFLCHYDRPAIFIAGALLRMSGVKVYTMSCSKFDDYERDINREWLKRFFFLPYTGAISSGVRARDYMRLMGIRPDKIATEYNTLSIERIRRMSAKQPAPGGTTFAERHFTIVARFVPKKNLFMAISAYASYCQTAESPRKLHLCGSGELERELRRKVDDLGLADRVVFHGFLQSDAIASVLGDTLALLLPSIEEQFGNVVIEAQAMGLPVIVSDNCGARDKLVRSGVNGFVVEPDNPEGLSFFMSLVDRDFSLWSRMSGAAAAFASLGDVPRFVEAVEQLTDVA